MAEKSSGVLKPDSKWNFHSGLPDDFDFWITQAEFNYLPEYIDQQGEQVPLLLWYGESPDVDLEHPISWSIGKGWVPQKGGRIVKHKDGRDKFFKTSMYGRLVKRVIEDLCVDMDGMGRTDPTDASSWVGLGFHMKREEIEYKGLMAEKGGKTERLMPVAFLGEAKSAKKSGKPATAHGPAPAEDAATTSDEALVRKLTILARNKEKADFQRMAMDMEEVLADEELMNDVCDDSSKGFWARARAQKP